jgi:hypothetical protein
VHRRAGASIDRIGGLERGGEALLEARDRAQPQLSEQLGAAGEAVVHRPARRARGPRDRRDAELRRALARREAERGVEQRVAVVQGWTRHRRHGN